MKDKVTISIDAKLKRTYEDLFGDKAWAALLDEAAKKRCLKEIEGIKEVIRIVEGEQEERRQQLIRAEQLKESLLAEQEKKIDVELELRREKWYFEHKESLKTQYDRRNLNWNWLAQKLDFSDGEKAKAWFLERINELT